MQKETNKNDAFQEIYEIVEIDNHRNLLLL